MKSKFIEARTLRFVNYESNKVFNLELKDEYEVADAQQVYTLKNKEY